MFNIKMRYKINTFLYTSDLYFWLCSADYAVYYVERVVALLCDINDISVVCFTKHKQADSSSREKFIYIFVHVKCGSLQFRECENSASASAV